jgi:FYVE zinc finger
MDRLPHPDQQHNTTYPFPSYTPPPPRPSSSSRPTGQRTPSLQLPPVILHNHTFNPAAPSLSSSVATYPQHETWIDFLSSPASQHPQQQPSSYQPPQPRPAQVSAIAERKRRFSALAQSPDSSPSRYTNPSHISTTNNDRARNLLYRDLGNRRFTPQTAYRSQMANRQQANSQADPSGAAQQPIVIDLTNDDDDRYSISRNRSRTGSNAPQSGIVIPKWQPDSDVSACPVCGTHFTLFFRKHHCRYVLKFLFGLLLWSFIGKAAEKSLVAFV